MKKHRKQRTDKGKPRGSYKNTGSSNGKTAVFETVNEVSTTSPVAIQENVQSTPAPLKVQTKDKVLTFEDLPKDRQEKVLKIIEWRKKSGLPDDSEDRIQRALAYYIWQKGLETK